MLRHAGIAAVLTLTLGCVPNDDSTKPAPAKPAPAPPPQPVLQAPTTPPAPAPAPKPAPAVGPPSADPMISEPFIDGFDRAAIGDDYYATSPVWRIENGRVCGKGARNHPLWLKKRLPVNARIEFDAEGGSSDGDIKVEVWGNGRSFAQTVSYTNASSYVVIFGGWKNQFHVLARIDEHAPNRPEVKVDPNGEVKARPVQPNRAYHFKIERSDGKTVRWLVDDIEIIRFEDAAPLKGPGHDHFGFNDWDVPVCFDNLKITPLEGS